MDESVDLAALAESVATVLRADFDRRRLHALIDGDATIGTALQRQAAELGWLSIGLSEESGGLGLGLAGLSAVQVELGRALVPSVHLATVAAAAVLDEVGSEEVRARLPEVASGAIRIAIPAQASPAQVSEDRIDPVGTRMLGAMDAAWLLVETDGPNGRGIALIEGGGERTALPMWDKTQHLFGAAGGAREPLLLIEGAAGHRACQRLQAIAAILLASDSLGGAEAILAQTIEYLKTREQFGKPIGSFQALKHRVADMSVLIRTGRSLLDQALVANGTPGALMWAMLAKASLTDSYRAVAADCLLLHGGIGFTWEHDCHLYLKRARLNETLLSPNSQLRDRAAEELARLVSAGHDVMEIVE